MQEAKDVKSFSVRDRIKSTNHAWRGVCLLFQNTHNLWVHVFFAALAVYLGWLLQITAVEWGLIVLAIGIVIIAEAFNSRETDHNPLHHAEIKAITLAGQIKHNWRLVDCEMYVTLEPCPMCLGALLQARLARVVFGAFDSKRLPTDYFPSLTQSEHSVLKLNSNNHQIEVMGGVLKEDCSQILKDFFVAKRACQNK